MNSTSTWPCILIGSVALFIALTICCFASTPPAVKTIDVDIPITNQIYLKARLNDSAPMWFILDTGATWSILDTDKAKELGIDAQGDLTLQLGQAHDIVAKFAKDVTLDISGIKVPVKQLAVMPAKFHHAPRGVRPDSWS